MKITTLSTLVGFALIGTSSFAMENNDSRELVKLPAMMQTHMMANMRDHLAAINEILSNLSTDNLDKAAEIAETRLGMTSLEAHGRVYA